MRLSQSVSHSALLSNAVLITEMFQRFLEKPDYSTKDRITVVSWSVLFYFVCKALVMCVL